MPQQYTAQQILNGAAEQKKTMSMQEVLQQAEAIKPAPTLMQKIQSYLPSVHTAAQVGGGIIGGAIGGAGGTLLGTPIGGVAGATLGGAAGSSIGESLYQLGSRMAGGGPQSSAEAAQGQTGALIGGAMQEGIPALINAKAAPMLEKSAAKKVGESVQAGGESLGMKRAIRKTAQGAIKDFPIATTEDGLLTKLEGKANDATAAVESAYNAAASKNFRIHSTPILKKLLDAKSKLTMTTPDPNIPGTSALRNAYDEFINWFQNNPTFTVDQFRQAKQVWDAQINHFRPGIAPDPARTQVLETAANAVRDQIHRIFPSIAKADAEAHTWITLRDVLKQAVTRHEGIEPLMRIIGRSTIGGSLGAGAAMYEGESPYKGALIGAAIGNLSRTTLWNTLSVKERAMLASALEKQLTKTGLKLGSTAISSEINR